MRQEKTMKIIINHFLDPRIVLKPNVGNDKSWVWVAYDFSENELIETVSCDTYRTAIYWFWFSVQTFAIRFGTPEIAQEFKKEFEKGQEEMKKLMSGADASQGKEEADEAAKVLENLKVEDADKKET